MLLCYRSLLFTVLVCSCRSKRNKLHPFRRVSKPFVHKYIINYCYDYLIHGLTNHGLPSYFKIPQRNDYQKIQSYWTIWFSWIDMPPAVLSSSWQRRWCFHEHIHLIKSHIRINLNVVIIIAFKYFHNIYLFIIDLHFVIIIVFECF